MPAGAPYTQLPDVVIRLFAILALTKDFAGGRDRLRHVVELRRSMSTQFYSAYVRKKARALDRRVTQIELGALQAGGGVE
jgi:hypothetical protein